MSYIKCKSIVTGNDVQYGLIDVSLKHKKRDLDYGCGNTNLYTVFWNTAPEGSSTYSAVSVSGQNPPWNIEFGTDGMKTVTGRPTQGYDASGELVSHYGYVHRGSQPIISNQVIDVENLNSGINTVDLFETDNIKVQMEIAKLKPSEFLLPNMYSLASFKREDGSYADKSLLYVITSVVIKQIYKPENKVVGTYSYLDKIDPQCFPNKFTVTTELFRIKDFDPRYTTWQQFDFGRSMWFDKGNTDQNTILKEGQNVSTKADCVVMNFSVMATDWWSASRNYFDYKQLKVVDSNGSEISNSTLRSLIATGVRKYLLHCIDDTPNDFITFVQAVNAYNAIPYSPYGDALTYMNSQVNGNSDYKITGYGVSNTTIFTVDNVVLSPLLIPHVDSNWNPTDNTTNGTFIPLTDTVFEGDPEPPEEEETLEEADDLNTEYDLDQGDGEEQFNYGTSDVISGEPSGLNAFRPSYANYIFKKMRFTSTSQASAYNEHILASMLQDLYTVTFLTATSKYFQLKDSFDATSVITRIFYLPFEYDEIVTSSAGIYKSTPYIPIMGPILSSWQWHDGGHPENPDDYTDFKRLAVSYYNQLANKYYILDLGQTSVQKVFNNYLDYMSEYVLNLPYGAGQVQLDPDILFDGTDTGVVKLKGYLDVEEGVLTIKVKINEQLVYETSVNVAIDASIANGNMFDISKSLIKMPYEIAHNVGLMMNGGSQWSYALGQREVGARIRDFLTANSNVRERWDKDSELRTQRHLQEAAAERAQRNQPITIGSGSIETFNPNPNFDSDIRHKFKPINKAEARTQEVLNELLDRIEGRS